MYRSRKRYQFLKSPLFMLFSCLLTSLLLLLSLLVVVFNTFWIDGYNSTYIFSIIIQPLSTSTFIVISPSQQPMIKKGFLLYNWFARKSFDFIKEDKHGYFSAYTHAHSTTTTKKTCDKVQWIRSISIINTYPTFQNCSLISIFASQKKKIVWIKLCSNKFSPRFR